LLEGAPAGTNQIAYEVMARVSGHDRSSGRVASAERVLVPWPFDEMGSRERALVNVKAWLDDGTETDWSDQLELHVGLLCAGDWSEPFVVPPAQVTRGAPRPGHLLRATFVSARPVRRALLHATAQGVYELSLNGQRVGDDVLSPGWTSYRHRLKTYTYDVTDLVREGENVLGAMLADGWFRGRIGFGGGVWDYYGRDVALLAQLEVSTDGWAYDVVPLAEQWRWSDGPVIAAGLYEGETFDARRLPARWDEAGVPDGNWRRPVLRAVANGEARLEPAIDEPVRVTQRLSPTSVEKRPGGRIRLDFGQNIAGKLAIAVKGPAGHEVRLHHAEVLERGELGVRPLRTASAIDSYTLRGSGEAEHWTPRFTVHGFRYAEVENWPGELHPEDVTALVVHTDMQRTGTFVTDHEPLNTLHENIVWSMRGNFVSLPTDCPNRDERLGWTGDIQVFAPAACFLYDSAAALESWLRDVSAEQGQDGWVPNFVPWLPVGFPEPASAAWGDAAVVVPWTLYQRYGDLEILREQYPSMKAWLGYSVGKTGSSGLIEDGFELGDWLDPAAPPDRPSEARTNRYLVANAYLIYSARLVAQVAQLLDLPVDSAYYSELAEKTLRMFRDAYLPGDGWGELDTQTGLALAIEFDLLASDEERSDAGRRLAELVDKAGYVVHTGFVGTPVICDALASAGQVDAAYALLLQEQCPSWLYQVAMGATTMWERWDSMLPDGSINPGEMTSFNHYAFGAVADFLHRRSAGLASAAPGYRELHIEPLPGSVLQRAEARLMTPYGEAASAWSRDGNSFRLEVVVPPGVTATVVVPDAQKTRHAIGSGVHRFAVEMPMVEASTRAPSGS
jgi:alpha-L-rhamnosidase